MAFVKCSGRSCKVTDELSSSTGFGKKLYRNQSILGDFPAWYINVTICIYRHCHRVCTKDQGSDCVVMMRLSACILYSVLGLAQYIFVLVVNFESSARLN